MRRADLSAVSLNGAAYLVGGYDGSTESAAVLATSDGTSFRRVANLVTTVRYTAVAAAHGRVWVFGGDHYGRPVRTIQVINPSSGAVRVAGRLPVALSDALALAVHGHLLIAGGRTSSGEVSRKVFEFDPVTGATNRVAELVVPVADAGYAVVAGRGYVFGGETGTPAGHPVTTIQVLSAVTRPAD